MGDGFLGYSASLMMDVVLCVLVAFVPLMAWSVYVVKVKRNYALHKLLQICLATGLFLTVGLFEVDIRMRGGWRNLVAGRSHPLPDDAMAFVERLLYVHLFFAVTSTLLWLVTFVTALRRMPVPPTPSAHSRVHRVLGWLSVVDLTITTVTGTWFYYCAFVAGA